MKRLLILLFLILSVIVGLVFLIPQLVSDAEIRAELSRQITSLSGSQVQLNGPVQFSFFPDIGVTADNVVVGLESDAFSVSAERVVASANLMSLLTGQLKITQIRLNAPQINIRNEPGTPNQSAGSETGNQDDIFELAASYIDTLSIDRLAVTSATLVQLNDRGLEVIASQSDFTLSAPGADQVVSFSFDGIVGSQKIKLDGRIDSLRNLLARNPTDFQFGSVVDPPPHPLIAKVSAQGALLLAEDGSYRVQGGTLSMNEDEIGLDIAYVPGERPFLKAEITAGDLFFEQPSLEGSSAPTNSGGTAPSDPIDLSFAKAFDLDLKLNATSLQTTDARARQVSAVLTTRQGALEGTIRAQEIAGGTLGIEFASSLNDAQPETWGRLTSASLDIASISRLAAISAPLDGKLDSNLEVAFRLADFDTIRNSFNARGSIGLKEGTMRIPQLAETLGPSAEVISGLYATATIENIRKPVQLSGGLSWKDQPVQFATAVPLKSYIIDNTGAANVKIQSNLINGGFAGTVDLNGSANGKLDLQSPSLSSLVKWIGIGSPPSFEQFSFGGDVAVGSGTYRMQNARINLDETVISGSGAFQSGSRNRVDANLNVNTLDLANFGGGGGSSNSGSNSGDETIDISALRSVDGQITLNAQLLQYGDVKTGPITTRLVLENGAARITIPRTAFYDGQIEASVTADSNPTPPSFAANINLANVNTLPLLRDSSGFDRLEGRLTSAIDVSGAGSSVNAVTRALNGNANVRFNDGAIRGIDVVKLIQNMRSVIQAGYQDNPADRTEFTEMGASFTLSQGVAETQDLRLLGPLLRMDGSGRVDLGNQTIDMRLNPKVVGSLSGQGGEFDVSGLEVPLIVSGPLSQPKVYPDLVKIIQNPQNALKTLSNLQEKIGNIGGGNLNPEALVSGQLDKLTEGGGSELIGGVLQNLGASQNGSANQNTGDNGAGNLVGNLLGTVLNQGSQPQPATAPPPQPAGNAGIVDQGQQFDVPVPTPNPRKLAGNTVPAQATPAPQPVTPQRQIIDQVLPPSVDNRAGDLLEGVLNQIGN